MSPVPLGIWAVAGAGNGATGSFDFISSTILTSNQASVTFDVSTLSSTYKHLQIRYTTRSSRTDTNNDELVYSFNNISGSFTHSVEGTGSTAISRNNSSYGMFVGGNATALDASGIYGAGISDFLDIFSSTKNKTIRTFAGKSSPTTPVVNLMSSLWNSTSVVTSIKMNLLSGANFVTGSRFSLYGIKE